MSLNTYKGKFLFQFDAPLFVWDFLPSYVCSGKFSPSWDQILPFSIPCHCVGDRAGIKAPEHLVHYKCSKQYLFSSVLSTWHKNAKFLDSTINRLKKSNTCLKNYGEYDCWKKNSGKCIVWNFKKWRCDRENYIFIISHNGVDKGSTSCAICNQDALISV